MGPADLVLDHAVRPLADDDNIVFSLQPAGGVEGTDGRVIIEADHRNAPGVGRSLQVFVNCRLTHAAGIAAVQQGAPRFVDRSNDVGQTFELALNASGRQGAGSRFLQHDQPVDLTRPLILNPVTQGNSGEVTGLEIVDAEIGRTHQRNVDRDHGNAGPLVLVHQLSADRGINLILDDQVDFFGDEVVGDAQGLLPAQTVVGDHQVDVVALLDRTFQAAPHVDGERNLLAQIGKPDLVGALFPVRRIGRHRVFTANRDLDGQRPQGIQGGGPNLAVGEEVIDLIDAGDGGQTDFAQLARIHQRHDAPGGIEHEPLELCLGQVVLRQAHLDIKADPGDKGRADVQIVQHGCAHGAGDGVAPVPDQAADEDHRIGGVLGQGLRGFDAIGDDGQLLFRIQEGRHASDGAARVEQDRLAAFHQVARPAGDSFFGRKISRFHGSGRRRPRTRAFGQNCPAAHAPHALLLLQRIQIVTDRSFRDV